MPSPTEKQDNPPWAIAYFMAYGFFNCVNYSFGKVLFNHHPEMGSSQLMFIRSGVSCLILVAWHRSQLKYIMWDSVDSKSARPLGIRVVTGSWNIFLNFYTVKYFSLTLLAMVQNCAPFVSMVLAGAFLSEKSALSDWVYLVISFAAIALVIMFGKQAPENELNYTVNYWEYLGLVCLPFSISAGNLAMRAMKKLPEAVCSCYLALSLLVIYLPVCLVTG